MEDEAETKPLDELFAFGFKAVKNLGNMDPSEAHYSRMVEEAINKLEECTTLVNQLNLFSVNETVEEISTPTLKFLLLPAFLSALVTRKTDDRLLLVEQSEVYLKDFLTRCTEYGLASWVEKKLPDDRVRDSLEQAALDRNAKIGRFKEQQRLDDLLQEVESRIAVGSAQEEEIREYYLNLIRYWCQRAVDDLDLAQREKQVLEYMKGKPQKADENVLPKKRPFKPFIIAKSAEQKKVFGAGYPSLPVLSVDEFYEKKYGKEGKGGTVSDNHCRAGQHSLQNWAEDPDANQRELEREAKVKEDKVENEDIEEIARMRRWDDWKDEHRRGEGNRKNMG